jgi:hypothetical protein
MFSRLSIAVAVACVALGAVASVTAASTANEVPIGRAQIFSSTGGGVVGDVFIRRQLTLGHTHLMIRLTGLAPGSQPVWKIESGAFCGSKSTAILLTAGGTQAATSAGGLMVSESHALVLPVQAGVTSQMTLRVYVSPRPGQPVSQVACAQIFSQPSLGSQHWW